MFKVGLLPSLDDLRWNILEAFLIWKSLFCYWLPTLAWEWLSTAKLSPEVTSTQFFLPSIEMQGRVPRTPRRLERTKQPGWVREPWRKQRQALPLWVRAKLLMDGGLMVAIYIAPGV